MPRDLDAIRNSLASFAHIRRSAIHGTGLFATQDIVASTWIGEYCGRVLTLKQANKLPPAEILLLFAVDENAYILGEEDTKYINHSCSPNLQAVHKDRRVFFQAIRNINAGQELTFDYQLANTEDKDDPYTCLCGSRNCRGTMSATVKT